MGTRSSIFIKKTDKKNVTKVFRFYKHYDGYPTGNLDLIRALVSVESEINSIKKAMSIASKSLGVKSEYEGFKNTLKDAVNHNEHGDLEWTYLVDLDAKNIKVNRAIGCDSKAILSKNGTDPLDYVNQLREECKQSEVYRTKILVAKLGDLGYTVNGKEK